MSPYLVDMNVFVIHLVILIPKIVAQTREDLQVVCQHEHFLGDIIVILYMRMTV